MRLKTAKNPHDRSVHGTKYKIIWYSRKLYVVLIVTIQYQFGGLIFSVVCFVMVNTLEIRSGEF